VARRCPDSIEIPRLLDLGHLEEARRRLGSLPDEPGPGASAYLRRVHAWFVAGERGPGYVTAALADASPVDARDPYAAHARCLEAALAATEALEAGDPVTAAAATRARRALPDRAPFLELVVASVLQAAFRFTGRRDMAEAAIEVAGRLADRGDVAALAVPARSLLGNVRMLQGRFHQANEDFGSALDLARDAGCGAAPERAMALQFRAYVLYEWNRLGEAAALLHEAAVCGEAIGSRGVRSGCYRMLARVELARNRRPEAERWLERLEELVDGRASLRNREWMQGVRAAFAAATADVRGAEAWMRARGYRVEELTTRGEGYLLARLQEMTSLLDVLLVLERAQDALALARAVAAASSAADRLWFVARSRAVEAAALDMLGAGEEAVRAVADALAAGREEGYVRVYADLGRPLLPVLERLGGVELRSRHLARVLAAAEAAASWRAPRPSLTDRELEVLGLMARGYSNKLIARRLGISLATVKTHAHHLFRKLQVSSRALAVKRAEALALI
jgi:LuxR family maltose regulon positive regulatory protein